MQLWWTIVMQINRLLKYFSQSQHEPKPKTPSVPATEIEEKQELLAHHVRLVARRLSNGLFIFSRGGLGKSRVVLRTLAEENVQPIILTAHVTPLSLYQALYANPNGVFFLDDCETLFASPVGLGLLRSALWGEDQGRRLVTYSSSQLEIPSSFHFSGSIIFAANQFPKRSLPFQAILSRIDIVEMRATNSDIIELLKHLAVEGFPGLSAAECLDVVNFIAEFRSTRELSLRLLHPSYKKVIYAKEAKIDWRDLVKSQLELMDQQDDAPKPADNKEFDVAALETAIQTHPDSVGEQQEAWCKATGKSRASFFRLKKSFDDQKGDDQNKKSDQPPSSNN